MKSKKHVDELLDRATVGPYNCQHCGTPVENIAVEPDVKLKCPDCGWEPVTVQQGGL